METFDRTRSSPALEYLETRVVDGVKFGLETVHALLAALDRPERAFSSLLVAGTNGKGSVVALVDSILRADGHRVGRYTSPHLSCLNERICVDGVEIGDSDLDAAIDAVRGAAERLVARGRISAHPTFFEILTLAALLHFRERGIEMAVLEVGMGGRLDATNTVEPLASAIVTIGLDHEKYLGDTLALIAREKAGVLRPGRTTVVGNLGREAMDAVRDEARHVGARVVAALDGTMIRVTGETIDVETPRRTYAGLHPLLGAHQRHNLAVALRLLEAAQDAGLAFDPQAVTAGVAATRWPGRLEWLATNPPILLDGAHNPAAARALADHLRDAPPFVLLFAAMRDKDIPGLARELFPLAREVVLTHPSVTRAATPAEIAERCGELAAGAHQCEGVDEALLLARSLVPPGGAIVVAGSLYLVGKVRGLLTRET